MRGLCCQLLLLGVLAACTARADLIWDNGNFDNRRAVSSEKDNYLVTHGSYAADDAVLTTGYYLQEIRWWGAALIDQNHPFTSYQAQYTILGDDPNAGLLYTSAPMTFSVTDMGTYFYGFRVYVGEVDVPDFYLTPGHYHFAVRLLSNSGRNFQLSTGNGVVQGESMGLFQGPDFWGGPPPPYWTTIQQFGGFTTDYAFSLHGIVPEPAGVGVLAVLGAFYRRRSR